MPSPLAGRALKALAASCLTSMAAWALTPHVSCIEHRAIVSPWSVSIADEMFNPGKVKIFDQPPRFMADGSLADDCKPLEELKKSSQPAFQLSRLKRKYWIAFYTKNGAMSLTLNFLPEGAPKGTPPASLSVSGVGKGGIITNVSFKNPARLPARFDDVKFGTPEKGPLLILE